MYYDLITDTDNLDITFEEESNSRSIVINAILQDLRIPIEIDNFPGEKLLDKGGNIGNALLNENNITGTLIWYYKRHYNSDNIKIEVENNIIRTLKKLKEDKTINTFIIQQILIIRNTINIYLYVDNSPLNITI